MKISKLIIYNLVIFIATLNVAYIYTSVGLNAFEYSKEYFKTIWQPIVLIFVLFLAQLFANLSYITTYSRTKKNLLRISLLTITILFIMNIIVRIIEYINGTFYIAGNILMLIYLIIIILNITMLKDLYHLVKKLFNQNN
ncbi:MAG: hypothetical protein PF569_07115 [Candidatus Woesearchaeota archaeon]|jgi:cytochrome c biogenesis factor|nr:hypothetical protein [Candidatus Woesearchaeota archaeon]